MSNTIINHDEFLKLHAQGKAEFMWNKEKALKAFSDMNPEIKTKKNKILGKLTSSEIYQKYRNNLLVFWGLNLLLLFTPMKLAIILSIGFAALMYAVEKLALKALEMTIVSDKESYEKLHNENVVRVCQG